MVLVCSYELLVRSVPLCVFEIVIEYDSLAGILDCIHVSFPGLSLSLKSFLKSFGGFRSVFVMILLTDASLYLF